MSKVTVDVDGTQRTLILDFNALASIEDSLGKKMTDMEAWKQLSMTEIRVVLHAALLRDWPDATLEDAGKLGVEALASLKKIAGGDPDPLAPDGSNSGHSEGTI